jgi:hypothetical protein
MAIGATSPNATARQLGDRGTIDFNLRILTRSGAPAEGLMIFVLRPRVSRRAFFHWSLVTNPSPGMVLRAQPLG